DVVSFAAKIQRLYAHAVTRQDQTPARLAPQRQTEHAAQPPEALGVPLEKGVQYHLRVTVGEKAMTQRLQSGAELGMIVNLAVINQNHVAILAAHGLLARHEVDDHKPHCTQRNVRGFVNALLVRPAMNQRSGGPAYEARLNRAVFVGESDNS